MRTVAVGPLINLTMGSDNAGKAGSVLYSISTSAKANQVEAYEYVRDLLVQLSRYTPSAAASLLPDA